MPSARLLIQMNKIQENNFTFALFFRYKHITSHVFVLIYWLREFPLSAVANHFELKCQSRATVAIVLQNLSLFFGYQEEFD